MAAKTTNLRCKECGGVMVEASTVAGELSFVCQACGHEVMRSVAAEACTTAAEQRAANKAEYHMALGVRLARAREAVLVPSATTAGVVYRVVNGHCDCRAGQTGRACWHVQAARRVS